MSSEPTSKDYLALAECYLALGLPAAARGLLADLVAEEQVAGLAHAHLAALASTRGDHVRALEHAEAARAAALPVARAEMQLICGEVCFAAGRLDAARTELEAVCAGGEAGQRTRARLSLAALALRERAVEDALEFLVALAPDLSLLPAERLEEVAELAVVAAAGPDLSAALTTCDAAAARFVEALLLEAERATDDEVEGRLAAAASELDVASLTLALRLARRRGRDPAARARAIARLEDLLDPSSPPALLTVSRARVQLLLSSLQDDDLAHGELAAEGYASALPLLPRDGTACNNLGVIALRGGDLVLAEQWFVRALVAEPTHQTAHRNLARVLHAAGSPAQLDVALERLRGAGLDSHCLAHLCFALAEVAREDAQQGIAAKGHELKNLLGVLGTRLRSLIRRAEGESKTELQGLWDRLSAIYDEWAAYLRTIREEVVAVDAIDVNALATEAAHQVGGRVRLRLAERLPELRGLRGQLLEALVNLLRNAAEASGDDAELSLRTELSAEGRVVRFCVADRGPGIPSGELRRVLHPGYTTKRGGSGLGLAICERIVQSHGGRLELESTPGVGTEVRLLLPVHLESQTRHGMLRTPLARVLRAAAADEYVIED